MTDKVNGQPVSGGSPQDQYLITGTDGKDKISGDAGTDHLQGLGGVDSLYGSAGNDAFILRASDMSDTLAAGKPQDLIYDFGGAGGYSSGPAGNDFISLLGFGAGATLTFDHYGKPGTSGVEDQHLQYYHINTTDGHSYNFFLQSLNGKQLIKGDYAFYG